MNPAPCNPPVRPAQPNPVVLWMFTLDDDFQRPAYVGGGRAATFLGFEEAELRQAQWWEEHLLAGDLRFVRTALRTALTRGSAQAWGRVQTSEGAEQWIDQQFEAVQNDRGFVDKILCYWKVAAKTRHG